MAARFPQSGSSVAYRIKPAWASKILVCYWAASANSVHRLRSSDTATTVLTRSTSGATFNATEGRIEGNSTVYFTDSIAGGYGGLQENSDFVFGASYYGDIFNGITPKLGVIGSLQAPDTFSDGFGLNIESFNWTAYIGGSGAMNNISSGSMGDDVAGWMVLAARTLQSDATAKQRVWANGAEVAGARANLTSSSTAKLGDTGRPLYFGGTKNGTGNTKAAGEFWFLGVGLSDADMVSITTDPSQVIEVYTPPSPSATIAWTEANDTTSLAGSVAGGSSGAVAWTEASDTASLTGSVASGTGSFTSEPLINNTGTVLTSQAVVWTWTPAGRVGSMTGKTPTDGTGTTHATNGTLAVSGLPLGAGTLMVAVRHTSASDDDVYYQAGTAA